VYVLPSDIGVVSFDALLAHPKGPLVAVVVLNIDKYMVHRSFILGAVYLSYDSCSYMRYRL
jgi:hypothetical protein